MLEALVSNAGPHLSPATVSSVVLGAAQEAATYLRFCGTVQAPNPTASFGGHTCLMVGVHQCTNHFLLSGPPQPIPHRLRQQSLF